MDIRLPDGSSRTLPDGATAMNLAESIGPGLARAVLAVKVNGQLRDLAYVLHDGDEVELITNKSEEGLEVIRHSTAHLLAMAVKELFPEAQVTIGPVIEDGFYYDFAYERPFTPEDLEAIEARMHEIARRKLDIVRLEWPREEAIGHFRNLGEEYKARLVERIPENEVVSIY
ncbi:MAG: TGS domain-containing protein, partial [Mariprofundaceae bacterium]|nr:TGS domain-containing protein [Mariprofundaceae bacterium]